MTTKQPALSLSTICERHPTISFTEFGGQGLLVVPHTAGQIVLSGSALRVLELIDGKRSIAKIAEQLGQEYEGEAETHERDVLEVLEDLVAREAVQIAGTREGHTP